MTTPHHVTPQGRFTDFTGAVQQKRPNWEAEG